MSLRTRLWLTLTLLLAGVLAANGFVILTLETTEVRASFEREGMTFARLAGPLALRAYGEAGRFTPDAAPALAERLQGLAEGLPAFHSLSLYSPRGKLLASTGEAPQPPVAGEDLPPEGRMRYLDQGGQRFLELTLPVRGRAESPPVLAQVLVSEAPVAKRVRALRLAYGASLAALLLVAALVAKGVAGRLLGPVEALRRAAQGIRDGDLASRVPEEGRGELAELARTFNAMARQVQEHRAELVARNEDIARAYAELQALQDELVTLERMAAVGRTAASVSHEIDNPIGVILGTAQMLRRELAGRGELEEDVLLIEAECNRCRRIVRDLLDFARPAARETGPVDVPAAVETLLRGLAHHPGFKGVTFRVGWPAEGLPAALADVDGVKQVLLNLFLNAAHCMGGEGEIAVSGAATEDFVRVTVADRGPGIEPECLERIFEPFYTTGAGTGLGLSVSRRIVAGAGGRLWAENLPGGGAAFHVQWPAGEA